MSGTVGLSLFSANPVGMDAETGGDSTVTLLATDADDTSGRLDIARVRHRVVRHADQAASVTYEVRTFGRFHDWELSRHDRHFVIELDADGEPGAERNITIYAVDGRLRADLVSNATRERLVRLSVSRRDHQTLEVRGSADVVGARKVFWTSNFHRRGVRSCGWVDGWPLTCQDSVPDRGWLRLDRSAWPPADHEKRVATVRSGPDLVSQ